MSQKLNGSLLTLRLIVGTLAGGVLLMIGISAYMRTRGGIGQITDSTTTMILLACLAAMALGSATASLFVRKTIVARAASEGFGSYAQGDITTPLLEPFRTLTIVTAALTEGPGLFAVVIHLVSGSTIALVAAFASAALLLTQLNLDSRLGRFVAEVTGRPY